MPKRKSTPVRWGNPKATKKRKVTWTDVGKRVAAKASGAALGYITGNVPGAIIGYKAGGAAAKWAQKVMKKKRKVTISRSVIAKRPQSSHNDLTVYNAGRINVTKRKQKPPKTPRFKIVNKSNFILNGSLAAMGVSGTVQGYQAIDYLDEVMHRNWLISSLDTSRFARDKLATDFYKFAIDYGYSFTGYQDGGVARAYSQNLAYVDHVSANYGFLSMTTVPQIVDVYFLTPKNDITVNPLTTLNTTTAQEGNGMNTAGTAFTTANTAAVDGKPTVHEWGVSPFSNPEFGKTWRCLKKISFTLNPGDQRHYKLVYDYKKYIQIATYQNYRVLDHLRNITVTPLVVARAGLVGIKPSAEAEAQEVAYGKAKVGVATELQIHLKACLNPRIQPLTRIHAGIQVATTDIIQEIDDEDNVKPVEQN